MIGAYVIKKTASKYKGIPTYELELGILPSYEGKKTEIKQGQFVFIATKEEFFAYQYGFNKKKPKK